MLTGGSTPERAVALAGAGQVVAALRRRGHEVRVVDVSTGPLSRADEERELGGAVGHEPPSEETLAVLRRKEDLAALMSEPALTDADLLFPVLHGRQGEGGQLQAVLELSGHRFVGSDAFGSALAMDKDIAKRLLRDAGIPVPAWTLWPASEAEIEGLGWPLIVKPSNVGSTVGLTRVEGPDQLEPAVELALRYDSVVLVEAYLSGRELTVGVLGDESLGVGEITTDSGLFDYHAKYTPGAAIEIFPAALDAALTAELQRLALEAHRALRLRHFSRIDFRLDEEGCPRCMEANTLPGMTVTSLLPQSAGCVGIDFDELVGRMVELALRS